MINGNDVKPIYYYNPLNFRITRILTTRNTGQDVLQDLNYTYDAVGNITQVTDNAQQTFYFNNTVIAPTGTYTYDALYRLIAATGRELTSIGTPTDVDFVNTIGCPNPAANAMQTYSHSYAYDQLGNMTNNNGTIYTYATANNQLTLTGYTYDAHGNTLTMPHLTNIGWDYLDQLHSAGNGTFTSYYNYDAEGKRTRKVVNKGTVVEHRYYFGEYEIYDKYVNGVLDTERTTVHLNDEQKRFVIIETLTSVTPFVVTERYQYDNHLGSACLELDSSSAIISYEEYYPFGVTSYRSGRTQAETSLKRYKYCGKERDEETGLYYYGMRYYAAWICRFVSVDPLQFKYPHYTPYQYAGNKPITYIDLDGREEDDPQKSKQGTLYINSKGETLGEIAGDPNLERDIIVVFDENVLNEIQENKNFDFSSITEEQSFTLPLYEMRQAIWNEIQNAGYDKDRLGNFIADFEIGGFIDFYKEYNTDTNKNTEVIGSDYVNRMRINGNIVNDNETLATISSEIDNKRDPITLMRNEGKDVDPIRKYRWHTHLNVIFNDVGLKKSYQEMSWLYDSAYKMGFNMQDERASEPSQQDKDNIIPYAAAGLNVVGIVIDMIGGVHLYNNKQTVRIDAKTFFNIK